MNSDIAISVRNLGKSYVIKHQNQSTYNTLRESLLGVGKKLLSRNKEAQSSSEIFWALQDVSFDVKRGEVFGIIGTNGAGKSTLLKLLSRISEPTEGCAEIKGRVASLLEVGTGFQPELSGRENIFLSGSLRGMKRWEIENSFDRIVEFAGVEKFVDTPVKRYSSGMYVRLAFSVATTLTPEILILDEVLAVGDALFQRRCTDRIKKLISEGRTSLFVSHSIHLIRELCTNVLWLDKGRAVNCGPTRSVTNEYLKIVPASSHISHPVHSRTWEHESSAPGDDVIRLMSVDLSGLDARGFARPDSEVFLEITYKMLQSATNLAPSVIFTNDAGDDLFASIDTRSMTMNLLEQAGVWKSRVRIPIKSFIPGHIMISLSFANKLSFQNHLFKNRVIGFNIPEGMEESNLRKNYAGSLPGLIQMDLEWQTVPSSL